MTSNECFSECGDFNKPQAITECTLSMLSQLYMAGLIPSDLYYRRQSTPVGPTGVEDTADHAIIADSIIVDVRQEDNPESEITHE